MNYSVYIAVYPNSTDDWVNNSPFTTHSLSPTDEGFAFGINRESDYTKYKDIPSRLVSIGEIDRKIDIIGSDKGVGGVTKVNDFTFSLENLTGMISDPLKLLGRTIKLCTNETSSVRKDVDHFETKVRYVGKIYSIEPSREELIFTVRGKLQLWNKPVGQLSESESDQFKDKIIPVVYGDFSDSHGYLPLIADKELNPKLKIDNQPLKEITAFKCYDRESKTSYSTFTPEELNLNSDNNEVESKRLLSDTIKVVNDIGVEDQYVDIYNPHRIAFTFTSEPSPALDETSVYEGGVYAEMCFLGKEDDYYLFTYPDRNPRIDNEGTLVKVAGPGPDTLTYNFRSSILEPLMVFEQTGESHFDEESNFVERLPEPLIIKIDDELMLVQAEEEIWTGVYKYECTRYYVERGYLNTSPASHYRGHLVYKHVDNQNKDTETKWLVKHTFPVAEVSNFCIPYYWNTTSDVIVNGWGKYYNKYLLDPALEPGFDQIASKITSVFKTGVSQSAQIVLRPVGDYSVDKKCVGLYMIDLHFPKVSISGEVKDMFLTGLYTGMKYNIVNGNFGIYLIKGGMPSKYVNWRNLDNIYYTDPSGGVELLSMPVGVGGVLKDFSRYNLRGGKRIGSYHYPRCRCIMFNGQGYASLGFSLRNEIPPIPYTNEYDTAPELDGMIYNINELNETRYSLAFTVDNITQSGGFNPDAAYIFNIQDVGLLIHFYINPIKVPVFAKGKGRVDISDNLIENPVKIIEDFFQKEIGLSSSDIGTNSYTKRDSWKSTLLLTKEGKSLDIIDAFAKENGLVVSEDNLGHLRIDPLDVPETVDRHITDSEIQITAGLADWKQEYTSVDKLVTAMDVSFLRNYAEDSEVYMNSVVVDTVEFLYFSYAKDLIDEDRKLSLKLNHLRDSNTVEKLIQLFGFYRGSPLRVLTIKGTPSLSDIRVGQFIGVTSSHVKRTSGKKYLCIGSTEQVGCAEESPYFLIKLLEIPAYYSEGVTSLQEVPNNPLEESWQEVPEAEDEVYENLISTMETSGGGGGTTVNKEIFSYTDNLDNLIDLLKAKQRGIDNDQGKNWCYKDEDGRLRVTANQKYWNGAEWVYSNADFKNIVLRGGELTLKQGITEPDAPESGHMVLYSDGASGNELRIKCPDGSKYIIVLSKVD